MKINLLSYDLYEGLVISFKKIKNIIQFLVGAFLFFLENSRRRYPYVLMGEKHNSISTETILQYRIVGKRHVDSMPARKMCNMKEIVSHFHPLDVRIIAFIAGVEQILTIDKKDQKRVFDKLKLEIFKQDNI